ncbi:hypothetical protein [Paenibacillus pabuli]|uniref:FTP domain-containing protein n=2 Tax=Paenibacillus TaxID=44249 RepID=A0A855XXZ6_9BACL|nr:hypothetical protein [Paenibacillus pabuli]PWW40774.1 hypothetical protein DET56_10546 [Paenibacillus pabuli]PXW11898.1 hypothetical protein DEU73_101769 [Paenibacillus taichungensis]
MLIKKILLVVLFMTILSTSEVSNNLVNASNGPSASMIFTEEEFQFQIKSKDIAIKIGNTREEVEQQLGHPVDYYYHTNVYQYKNMRIHYKAGIVDGIMIDDLAIFRKYKTPRGIGFGSTIQEVIQQYGKKAFIDSNQRKVSSITYVMERNKQGDYSVISSFDKFVLEGGYENLMGLSMVLDQRGRVSFLMIADYEFAYHPEFRWTETQ